MFNGFYYIFQKIQKYHKTAFLLALLFLVASVFIVRNMTFNEDINRILPKNRQHDTSAVLIGEMNFADKVAVIFKKKGKTSDEDLENAAQSFIDTLPVLKKYYRSVQGTLDEDLFRNSFEFVYSHLPLYLNEDDYQNIEERLNRDSIEAQVQRNYELLTEGTAGFMKEVVVRDPLQLSFLALKKMQQLQGGGDYKFENGYLYTNDGQKIMLFIDPVYGGSETEHNEFFTEQLEHIRKAVQTTHPEVEVLYFGSPFIAVANAKQIKHDILTTVAISVSALMLLLVFYYRSLWIPVIVMIPTIFGGFFGLLCLYFLRTGISAISLSVAAILIGITIDYALHFLTHSKSSGNMRILLKDVTRPLLMSSSTTAVAFLCLLFVHSDALVDLGIFASISVVATAVFTLIILPHVYKGKALKHNHIIDRVARYPFEKNKFLLSFGLLLIMISAFTYHKVVFDGDLSKINYMPEEQHMAEKELYADHKVAKTLFVVVHGNDQDEVLRWNDEVYARLERFKNIKNIQSVSVLLPSKEHQREAIGRWNAFWNPERIRMTVETIERASTASGFNDRTHESFYRTLEKAYGTVNLDTLKQFSEMLSREFVHGKNRYIVSTVVTLDPGYRDSFIREFESELQDLPALIIDRQALNEQYLGYLVNDFNSLVSYSFVAVFIILFIFYRRIELVLVAAVPIALTGFITAGLMGLLNIPFNIFSTIVCTLVFGHGIDFTIFMTSALQKQYTDGKDEMPLYRTSIILAVLTTILAIGALVFAKHPALKSIALIALVGVSVAVLVTFVLYPVLYRFLFFNRIRKGLSPVTLWLVVQSILMFAYYFLASLVVSVFMRCVFWILPFSKEKKWLLFGKIMSGYMKSVLYLKPTVDKKIVNKERFRKQSVIIANHTSFLDSLTIGMTKSEIVYIVNDWVYKSPVFGRAVKFLGFYPATRGVEKGLEPLEVRLGTEFSVVIFPEGTRSRTSEIGRFHKGAFFMAEELQWPVQPVFIHGNADLLPKGDFVIYDTDCHVYVGEAVAPDDEKFGTDYAERTKRISRHFKEEYRCIRLKAEGPDYFKQKLLLNFLYKEHGVKKTVKKDFKENRLLYHALFRLIGEKVAIAHITSDYGQTDFLLVNQFPARKITVFNTNVEHRAVAQTSYIVNKFTINYVENIDEVWKKNTVLLLSHLQEFKGVVPLTVQQVVVVCCGFEAEFQGFRSVDSGVAGVQIYERYETD